jgi:hypothetical protein
LIGTKAPDLAAYAGFNPNVNPGVSTEFSASAFRVGHTFLSGELLFHDGTQTTEVMSLIDLFFTPGLARENPNLINEVLIRQTVNEANAANTKVINKVHSFLFGTPIAGEGRDFVVFVESGLGSRAFIAAYGDAELDYSPLVTVNCL